MTELYLYLKADDNLPISTWKHYKWAITTLMEAAISSPDLQVGLSTSPARRPHEPTPGQQVTGRAGAWHPQAWRHRALRQRARDVELFLDALE